MMYFIASHYIAQLRISQNSVCESVDADHAAATSLHCCPWEPSALLDSIHGEADARAQATADERLGCAAADTPVGQWTLRLIQTTERHVRYCLLGATVSALGISLTLACLVDGTPNVAAFYLFALADTICRVIASLEIGLYIAAMHAHAATQAARRPASALAPTLSVRAISDSTMRAVASASSQDAESESTVSD